MYRQKRNTMYTSRYLRSKALNPIKKIPAVEAISVYREWRVNNVNMAFGQLRIRKE